MKNRAAYSSIAILIGIICLALYSQASSSDVYIVRHVIDGDTIVLDDGRHVRLIGVDAPEVDSPYRKAEPYGEESKEYLERLLERRLVTIKLGKEKLDKYGRTLAYVYLNHTMVNAKIKIGRASCRERV